MGEVVPQGSLISVEYALRELAVSPGSPDKLRLYFQTRDAGGLDIWHPTNHYAIVQQPDNAILGYTKGSPDMEFVADIGRAIDWLLDDYQLDTLGVVADENRMFVALRGKFARPS